MNKREFIRRASLLTASAAVIPSLEAGTMQRPAETGPRNSQGSIISNLKGSPVNENAGPVTLKDKFFGCIAGCHIGSAMGAPMEGSSWETIEKEYGTLDRFLPYHHYGNSNDWMREPGTTEDGVERQKLMITAILEKNDRINAEDLRRSWVDHMNPDAAGLVSEPFEGALLTMARSHVPASDIGKYCDYSGLVSLSRSCHPIGLINAGDIQGAIDDVREVGQIYNTANSRGILWAEVVVIAIAEATKPGATVDSVIGAILDNCDQVDTRFMRKAGIRREIEKALELTSSCTDFRQMREKFDMIYSGSGIPYAYSYANEIVTKAVCVFSMTRANTWEAIIAGVNMGRDTDCLTAVAAGISGSLSGGSSIPDEIIRQCDHATSVNPHTNSQRTLAENSDGLYEAFLSRIRKLKTYAEKMEMA